VVLRWLYLTAEGLGSLPLLASLACQDNDPAPDATLGDAVTPTGAPVGTARAAELSDGGSPTPVAPPAADSAEASPGSEPPPPLDATPGEADAAATSATPSPSDSEDASANARASASEAPAPLPTTPAPALADYVRLGEPFQLADLSGAVSDVAWSAETDTFFVVPDRSLYLYEFDSTFDNLLRTVELIGGPGDAEGLEHLGDGWLAMASEDNRVVVFQLPTDSDSIDLQLASVRHFEPAPPPPRTNTGFEGIAFRPQPDGSGEFFVCQEGAPGEVPIAVYRFPYSPDGPNSASYADGSLDAVQPFDAQASLGHLGGDLTGMAYEPRDDTLLLTSHLASRLLKVDPASGALLEELELNGSPQYEGVTLASNNRLVLISESNWVELWQVPAL
jgi:uncharacterized protein YjiK